MDRGELPGTGPGHGGIVDATVNIRPRPVIPFPSAVVGARPEVRALDIDPDLALAYEQLPSALFIIDAAEDRIVHANQAACELCGHPRRRLLGRLTISMFETKLQPILLDVLATEPGGTELSTRLLPRRGPSLPIAIRIRPLQIGGRRLCLLLAFDISRMAHELDALGELNERVDSTPMPVHADPVMPMSCSDPQAHRHQAALASALHRSLSEQTLEQVWLPIINIADQRCIGVESLLRGGGASIGFSTASLIDTAAERGLLPELGRAAARLAADGYRLLVSKRRSGLIDYFGLNLRAQELLTQGHLDALLSCIDGAGMSISRLVVELAERDLVEHLDALQPVVRELRQMRVRIAIDGFGSGPSSFALLRDLPVDLIKIDRSFIWRLDTSPRAGEIVRAMITLAHGLDIQTVAVGIETRTQLDLLGELGCDFGQGFLLSRPLPSTDLADYLRRRTFALAR